MTIDNDPTPTAADDATPPPEPPEAPESSPRRRAASRPAGPPQGDSEPTLHAPEPAEKRTTRRRAAKKAAPAQEAPEPAAGEETDAVPPAKRTPRKRAPKNVQAPVDDELQTLVATTAEPVASTEPVEAAAEPAEETAREAGQETAEPEPAVTGMAVLFQAPEPATVPPRRRRGASRPAGPPPPAPEATTGALVGAEAPSEPLAEPSAEPAWQESGAETAEASVPEVETEAETEAEAEAEAEAEEDSTDGRRRRRRRGGRGRRRRAGDGAAGDTEQDDVGEDDAGAAEAAEDSGAEQATGEDAEPEPEAEGPEGTAASAEESASSKRRRRRRRRGGGDTDAEPGPDDPPNTVVKVRPPRRAEDDVTALKGSTRLEAKRQRRREGRETGRRRQVITEAEFLARRESVERVMVVRQRDGRTQIAVLEDGVLVEHYVSRKTQGSMIGNVYLGRVQNVLPSMEAAFVDVGKGRNAVLYAGEVNWDAAGLDGQPKRIEAALKSGDAVLVQVTKDPIGHKGARLTSQVSLPGRYLVYVPNSSMTGISRKLPDTERNRLKKILKDVVPADAGVIVRTAAEGASEEELTRDITRLKSQWADIEKKAKAAGPPAMLYSEPDLMVKVVRDVFNEDFTKLVVSGDDAWGTVHEYVSWVAPDLADRMERWEGEKDAFAAFRIDEQIAKALERKVWLPSGGSLVIDRTEAMTVIDVNTGKFTGAGGTLEETVTRNNLEAAEEIVRQLRLRDIGGIIVVDFIDMVLESNRDLVVRRLVECLGRDRTKHQVAEVTSLGLVQMTRKKVGQGLLEAFSEPCEHCGGRGVVLHEEPVPTGGNGTPSAGSSDGGGSGSGSGDGAGRRRGSARQIAAAAARAATRKDSTPTEAAEPAEPTVASAQSAATATDGTDASSGVAVPQEAEVVEEPAGSDPV